jgi:hypothetical protein
MSLTTRFIRLAAGWARRRPNPTARPTRTCLCVERLESRLVLDISINFVGGGGPGGTIPPMDPSEVAGVVPYSNWNNEAGNTKYNVGPLVDQNGNVVAGTNLTYASNNTWTTGIVDAPGDNRLMGGYLDTTASDTTVVYLTGVTGLAPYDVYVYFSGDTHDVRHGFYTVLGLGTQEGQDTAPFTGTYVRDTGSGGNYLLFTGGTSDSLVLLATPQDPNSSDNGFRAPVEGIQIVTEVTGGVHYGGVVPAPLAKGLAGGLALVATTSAAAQSLPALPKGLPDAGTPTAALSPAKAQVDALFATTQQGAPGFAVLPGKLEAQAASGDWFADAVHQEAGLVL